MPRKPRMYLPGVPCHVIQRGNNREGISRVMQSIGRRYVQYINKEYQRCGTLWESRHKASLVDAERYLLTCCRYIELNPVAANMVKHPGGYTWSSYRHNAFGEKRPAIWEEKEKGLIR